MSEVYVPCFEALDESSVEFLDDANKIKYCGKEYFYFRSSSLSSCPKQYMLIRGGESFAPMTRSFFLQGTKVHYLREKLSQQAIPLEKEKQFFIRNLSKTYIVGGKMDNILIDEVGLFLQDYKTCEKNAFYFKMKEGVPDNYLYQMSIYKYIYYVNTGMELNECAIQFVNKQKPREFLQLTRALNSLSDCEQMIIQHPVIRLTLGQITPAEFDQAIMKYIAKYSFFCAYCGMRCPHNKTK